MRLRPLIEQYVTCRQSLGEKFATNGRILRAFARGAGPDIAADQITLPATTRFLYGAGPVKGGWYNRHNALKGLFRYALARGYIARVPLPEVIPERPPPFVPYIYTAQEVRRLLAATEGYQHTRRCLEPVTMRVLILLLYATGLRVHEAVALQMEHVDLDQSLLTVVQSKFYKTRLVPFGPQLGTVLRDYCARPTAAAAPRRSAFLTTRYGAPLKLDTVQGAYRRTCQHAGVNRTDGASFQPRLHDLRHTFAVTRLLSWYKQGLPVQRLLPHLSVYLGHAHLAATQVYLTVTPELWQQANQRFRRYAITGRRHD